MAGLLVMTTAAMGWNGWQVVLAVLAWRMADGAIAAWIGLAFALGSGGRPDSRTAVLAAAVASITSVVLGAALALVTGIGFALHGDDSHAPVWERALGPLQDVFELAVGSPVAVIALAVPAAIPAALFSMGATIGPQGVTLDADWRTLRVAAGIRALATGALMAILSLELGGTVAWAATVSVCEAIPFAAGMAIVLRATQRPG